MRNWLSEILVDPRTGSGLTLEDAAGADGDIISGTLVGPGGSAYPVRDGIPRFVGGNEPSGQTADSFGYKWSRRSSYESEGFATWYEAWLLGKYGFADRDALRSYFGRFKCVLEVGCGSGMSSVISLNGLGPEQQWVGLDLSNAVDVAAQRIGGPPNIGFVQADVLALPFAPGSFDVIFAEGVLHHTPSTRQALASLASVVAPGGELMFYVYATKAPIREAADDLLRARISQMAPEEAWRSMGPLTNLAKALANLHAIVEVPEDVEVLGIKAGSYDVQRLLYWHFAKLFWNPDMGFEGSQHVNFDWYHPPYAFRQTEAEVRTWCAELGLTIIRFDVQESGFTVCAVRG
jgi:arsenite methyltransferase